MDVDVVLHGVDGPPGLAASWAAARSRRPVVLARPRPRRLPARPGGSSGHRPPRRRACSLAGDETAVPAISAIVEALPGGRRDDRRPRGARRRRHAVPRRAAGGRGHAGWSAARGARGEALGPAVHAALRELGDADRPPAPSRGRRPRRAASSGRCPGGPAPTVCYAWLAGEAGMVKAPRRPRPRPGRPAQSVAFMGYWRTGAAEGSRPPLPGVAYRRQCAPSCLLVLVLFAVWVALTVIGWVVKGLFWLAVVGPARLPAPRC